MCVVLVDLDFLCGFIQKLIAILVDFRAKYDDVWKCLFIRINIREVHHLIAQVIRCYCFCSPKVGHFCPKWLAKIDCRRWYIVFLAKHSFFYSLINGWNEFTAFKCALKRFGGEKKQTIANLPQMNLICVYDLAVKRWYNFKIGI